MNERQINAILFYEGDVSGDDPFWGDPKAYVTLNSLLFPGTENEKARAREGKRLNPAMLKDPERLLQVYRDLLSAAKECRTVKERKVWRVERFSDYVLCRDLGRTISFTSTSTAGFLGQYGDKLGLAVMEFTLPSGTPCINLAEALNVYAKAEEAEILLPPGLPLSFTERAPRGEELRVTDMEGKPPVVFAEAQVVLRDFESLGAEKEADEPAYELLRAEREAGERFYTCLNEGRQPDITDETAFLKWKEWLQEKLMIQRKKV